MSLQVVEGGQNLFGFQVSQSPGLVRICNSVSTDIDPVYEFPTVFYDILTLDPLLNNIGAYRFNFARPLMKKPRIG